MSQLFRDIVCCRLSTSHQTISLPLFQLNSHSFSSFDLSFVNSIYSYFKLCFLFLFSFDFFLCVYLLLSTILFQLISFLLYLLPFCNLSLFLDQIAHYIRFLQSSYLVFLMYTFNIDCLIHIYLQFLPFTFSKWLYYTLSSVF